MSNPHLPLNGTTISFDFDGVLVRSPFGHSVLFPVLKELGWSWAERTGATAEMGERHVRQLAWAEFRGRTSRGEHLAAYDWQAIVETVAKATGQEFGRSLAAIAEEFAQRLSRTGDLSELYPDAHEVLDNLRRRGACLLLLTNGLRAYQLPLIRALGLDRFFDRILASDDLGTVKPFREAFERAFSFCTAPAYRRYHVGDTLTVDVAGALASGIFAIWVEWELPDELGRLGPLERARSPALEDLLRRRLEREGSFLGVPGFDAGDLASVRPDAVVSSLREIELVVDGTGSREERAI